MATLSRFLAFFFQSSLDFFSTAWALVANGGWIIYVITFFAILFTGYMKAIQRKYIASIEWVNLRVRVPEGNQRNPRSMEELLNSLHGIHKPPDLMEIYLDGYVQAWAALELRGTAEGVAFIVRVPVGSRDLAEASIYAQYPDAEIDDVADYAAPFTQDLLGKEFNFWGSEMMLSKPDAYPIKTYVDFEDEFAVDARLVDSMAAITELLSTLKPGEEAWLQILIRPVFADKWQQEGMELALKLAGREVPKTLSKVAQAFALLGQVATMATTLAAPVPPDQKKERVDLGVLRLTPGETDVVRAIQRNVSKVAFETRVRIVYVAPKTVFDKRLRIGTMFGIFRQFSSYNLNSFRPDTRITTSRPTYGLVKMRRAYREHRLLKKYRKRDFGGKGFIFNVEELATLYHFPVEYVKTPAVEHARAKRGEAPTNVPLAPEDLPLA